MLKQRLIFGILGAVLAVGVVVFCPVKVVGIILALIALIGLGEFYNVTGLFKKKTPAVLPGFAFCLSVFYSAVFAPDKMYEYALIVFVVYVFLLMTVMVFFRSKCTFADCAISFAGAVYISVFFAHIILLRQLEAGKLLIWVLLISAWGTDTCAYFAGRALGKHKLCPSISPKKTVEGAIGGTLGCILLVGVYLGIIANVNGLSVNWLNTVVVSALAALFSQIGDLAASCIKRDNNSKDYGNLIPGHGGILDRFDSVLLISPLCFYLMVYLPVLC